MDSKMIAHDTVEAIRADIIDLSHRIHAHPEPAFAEYQACAWIADALREGGYQVETGAADLPTALTATIGHGELVLGICAEYDALPGIGHACGHNIIAAAAIIAARALAPLADELGLTVKVFGTPAEEQGGGKILMLDRGVFDGVHAAMMVHPSPHERVEHHTLAVAQLEVSYTGKTAHAAMAPEKGINAGDALTVAQVAVGLLRQHIDPADRIHGITTHGGEAPNIVPGATSATYYIRSRALDELEQLQKRVHNCFQAGATATGCTLQVRELSPPYSQFRNDDAMARLYRANAEAAGRTFPELTREEKAAAGSTDMANVSLVIPTIHPMLGIECGDSVNHQPEFTTWCAQPSADDAAIEGGLAMAWTAIDLATDPDQRTRLTTPETQDTSAPAPM